MGRIDNMKVTIFSAGDFNGSIMEAFLDTGGIEYDIVSDPAQIAALGIRSLPALRVHGVLLEPAAAWKWIHAKERTVNGAKPENA